jgi:hypothetical protein
MELLCSLFIYVEAHNDLFYVCSYDNVNKKFKQSKNRKKKIKLGLYGLFFLR